MKNQDKTADSAQRLIKGAQADLAEHQPATVTKQEDALQIEVPETQLDRIERHVADIAKRIAGGLAWLERMDKRNRYLD